MFNSQMVPFVLSNLHTTSNVLIFHDIPKLVGKLPWVWFSPHLPRCGHHSDDWTKPSWPLLTVLVDRYISSHGWCYPILSLCWGWFMIVCPWLSMMISPWSCIDLSSVPQNKSYCIQLWHWVYHILLVVPGLPRPRWVGVGKTCKPLPITIVVQ